MWVGDVVAGRFIVESPIGAGGMGSVFRALDRTSGEPVALKVMDLVTDGAAERFEREARLLSALSHPGIVRYVAHGETESRQPFLAMELLEGEELSQRLSRGRLSVEDSLALTRRVAEALAFAHGKGVVHRDIKPSNLLLVGSDVGRVKVLDFGIARADLQTQGLTQTGAMLGTMGYMAPEQAMGSRDIDARVDVFALGCVLFECLTGRPAFAADHAVAILAKVLTEEAPRVSELLPEVGDALDSVVRRMLTKRREGRPSDAAEVLRLFDQGPAPLRSSPFAAAVPPSLTHSEQRIVTVILAAPPADAATTETVTPEALSTESERARELAGTFGAEFMPLKGGGLLFMLSGGDGDQVTRAASCVLATRKAWPTLSFSLATGRAETTGRLPIGAVIDRAAALLPRGERDDAQGRISVDALAARLLEARFVVERAADAGRLIGERRDVERPRLLLGRPTPCVGREKDLSFLEIMFRECVEESAARAIVALGPAGIGKSRLRQEFVARVKSDAKVLVGRADPVAGRAPLALVRQLLVAELQLGPLGEDGGEDRGARHARVRAAISSLIPEAERERVTEFLGEIAGAPPPEDSMTALFRAGKNNPGVMAEHTRRAFEDWALAEAARGPLVLVLEDVHWADEASVSYLEGALRSAGERPLFVLALARPEVRERATPVFPEAQELRLSPLTRRASESLVHAVLGDEAEPERVSRIVEQAAGNAFYLEELIRAAAEGQSGAPESVLAMIEARISRLPSEHRRVLRAASVFGERFWDSAVAELVGDTADGIAPVLDALRKAELIEAVASSRFAGTNEYAVRHALVRDAAYAMLTDADRVAAHERAGEWLGMNGEVDPLAVADHFEKANAEDKALPWVVAALHAELRHLSGGASSLRSLVRRGELCHASGETLGVLRMAELYAIEADAFPPSASEKIQGLASEAFDLLLPGSDDWWLCARLGLTAGSNLARPELFMMVLGKVLALPAVSGSSGPYAQAIRWLIMGLIQAGQRDMALSMLDRLDQPTRDGREPDLVFTSELALAEAYVKSSLLDDVPASNEQIHRALETAEKAGRRELVEVAFIGVVLQIGNGDLHGARKTLDTLGRVQPHWNQGVRRWMTAWEAYLELQSGRPVEALALARPLLEASDPFLVSFARTVMTFAFLRLRKIEQGEREARSCLDVPWQTLKYPALVNLAACEMARSCPKGTLSWLERAFLEEDRGAAPDSRSLARLLKAEAHHALGDNAGANAAIRAAADRIRAHTARMPTAELRNGYLEIEAHARTLELEREWLGT